MAIDPMQVIAMQQSLTDGLGVGIPGAYGATPQALGGLLRLQSLVGKTNQFGIPIPPFSPGDWLRRFGIGNIPIPRSSLPAGGSIAGGQLAPQGLFDVLRRAIPPIIPIVRQLLPFGVDPLTAAYAGGQLAPQGFDGRLLQPQTILGPNEMDLLRRFHGLPPLPRPYGPLSSLIL